MPELLAVLSLALVSSCAASALITCGLGAYVLGQNPSSATNRLFFAATLSATCWGLGEFFIWQSTDFAGFQFWLRASSFWGLVIAFSVHFVLAFTGHPLARREKRGILLMILYLPAALIALIGFSTDLIFEVAFQPGVGYFYHPATGSPISMAAMIYAFLAMTWGLYAGFSSWRRARPGRERRQHRLILIGIAIVVSFGILSGLIFPAFGIHTVNFVFLGFVLFSLAIAHAIHKHGLFALSPQAAVPDILRTMPDGLILVDTDSRIVTANTSTAEILGVAEADLAGQPAGRFIPDTVYGSIRTAIARKGRFSDLEAVLDGSVVSISGTLVRNPDGEPAGIVLIIRDITDRKSVETALRTTSQKLSLLSRVTCHDIGNDIMGLSWYLNLLSEDRTHPDAGRYLSYSVEIVENIKKHLDFSRDYQMAGVPQPVWQPLEPMIAGTVSGFRNLDVEISTRLAPVEIYADPLSPKVVYNLIENAIRHTDKTGRICITAAGQADGTLVVAFKDSGPGIPEDMKEMIFSYGYGKNTGFGLAFSRDVLSVTGIGIRETGTEGKGARFEILVPPGAWRPLQPSGPGFEHGGLPPVDRERHAR